MCSDCICSYCRPSIGSPRSSIGLDKTVASTYNILHHDACVSYSIIFSQHIIPNELWHSGLVLGWCSLFVDIIVSVVTEWYLLDTQFTAVSYLSLILTLGEYSILYSVYQTQGSLITNHRRYGSIYIDYDIEYDFMTLEERAKKAWLDGHMRICEQDIQRAQPKSFCDWTDDTLCKTW